MNFEHDLTAILTESFHRAGIKIPKEWDDDEIRMIRERYHLFR